MRPFQLADSGSFVHFCYLSDPEAAHGKNYRSSKSDHFPGVAAAVAVAVAVIVAVVVAVVVVVVEVVVVVVIVVVVAVAVVVVVVESESLQQVQFPPKLKGTFEDLVKKLCVAEPSMRLPMKKGGVQNIVAAQLALTSYTLHQD